MLAGIPNQADIFLLARILEGAEHLMQQHVGKADDGVQRRAKFVADDRQEPSLGDFGGKPPSHWRREFFAQSGNFVILAQDEREDIASAARRASVREKRPIIVGRQATVILALSFGRCRSAAAGREDSSRRDRCAIAHVGQCAEIGDAVGQMDAVEQAGAEKQLGRQFQKRARLCGRIQDLAMAGDPQDNGVDNVFEPVAGDPAIGRTGAVAKRRRRAGPA